MHFEWTFYFMNGYRSCYLFIWSDPLCLDVPIQARFGVLGILDYGSHGAAKLTQLPNSTAWDSTIPEVCPHPLISVAHAHQ